MMNDTNVKGVTSIDKDNNSSPLGDDGEPEPSPRSPPRLPPHLPPNDNGVRKLSEFEFNPKKDSDTINSLTDVVGILHECQDCMVDIDARSKQAIQAWALAGEKFNSVQNWMLVCTSKILKLPENTAKLKLISNNFNFNNSSQKIYDLLENKVGKGIALKPVDLSARPEDWMPSTTLVART